MSAKDPVAALKDAFKLSLYEAKAYLALLQGASDPKSVARLGRVPLPRVYDTLRSLEAKGFVVRSGEAHVPVKPEIALEGRIQQFESEHQTGKALRIKAKDQLLQSLRMQPRENHEREIAMLGGINNIANKFSEVLARSKTVILTVKKAFEARNLFLRYLASESSKEKRRIRILMPTNLKISKEEATLLANLGVEIRIRDDILLDLMVSDTDDVMVGVPDPLSEEPYHAIAIWTKNSSFAKSLRGSLDDLWEKSKNA
ncbi:MAG: TrmB family transcriptional regulator [Thaumarchaeota archaeon]|nr:TrmB family transcriptional regulator [Nitrososphaerota archaeon]